MEASTPRLYQQGQNGTWTIKVPNAIWAMREKFSRHRFMQKEVRKRGQRRAQMKVNRLRIGNAIVLVLGVARPTGTVC